MRSTERVLLLYGLATAGAVGLALYRGQRGSVLLTDVLLQGAIAGTAINVGAFLLLDSPESSGLPHQARSNSWPNPLALLNSASTMGNMSRQAVQLLSHINSDEIYTPLKANGIKVGPVPKVPSFVAQDER